MLRGTQIASYPRLDGFDIIAGTTDTDITAIESTNADAETCYFYVNATQDAMTVSATHP